MDFKKTAFAFLVDKSGSMATFEKSNYNGLEYFINNAPTGFCFSYTKHRIINHAEDDVLSNISFVPNKGDIKVSDFEDGIDVQNNCTRLGDAIVQWFNSAIGPYVKAFPKVTTSLFFIIVSDGLQDSSIEYSISQTRHALEVFINEMSEAGRRVIPYIFYFGLNDFTRNVIDVIHPDAWCLTRKESTEKCYRALVDGMNSAEVVTVDDFIGHARVCFNNVIKNECEDIGISFNGLLNSETVIK